MHECPSLSMIFNPFRPSRFTNKSKSKHVLNILIHTDPPYDHIIHFWNSLPMGSNRNVENICTYLHQGWPQVTRKSVYHSNLPQSNHPDKKNIDGIYGCNRLDPVKVTIILSKISFWKFNQLGVSKNSGTPKSSILIGFSIINHPFWSTPIVGNTQLYNVLPVPHATLPGETHCFTPNNFPGAAGWHKHPLEGHPYRQLHIIPWQKKTATKKQVWKLLPDALFLVIEYMCV